jgi:hypothetical protein
MKMVTIFKRVNGKWLIHKLTRIGYTEGKQKAFDAIGLTVTRVSDVLFRDANNNEYFVCDR